MARGRVLVVVALALLALAALPLLGSWALGVAALLLLVVVAVPWLGGGAGAAAIVLGVLGGLVGAASAGSALQRHASDPLYGERAWFGWTALALALVAAAGGALALARPKAAAALLVVGSTLGFIAINLFDINTFYFVAVPACWLGAALALARSTPSRGGRR